MAWEGLCGPVLGLDGKGFGFGPGTSNNTLTTPHETTKPRQKTTQHDSKRRDTGKHGTRRHDDSKRHGTTTNGMAREEMTRHDTPRHG